MKSLPTLMSVLTLVVLSCSSPVRAGTGPVEFTRGDASGDGTVNIADAVFLLSALFTNGTPPPCEDAADANDDGSLNVADAVAILGYLFDSNITMLPAPSPGMGTDPTADGMTCDPLCTDPNDLLAGLTALFPTTVCAPSIPINDPSASGTLCGSGTGPTCSGLMMAGCDVTVNLTSISYDPMTESATAVGDIVVDPLELDLTVLSIFNVDCNSGIASVDIDVTVQLTTVPAAPGSVLITNVMSDVTSSNLNLDLTTCGLSSTVSNIILGLFGTGFTADLEMQAEVAMDDFLGMTLIGQEICQ